MPTVLAVTLVALLQSADSRKPSIVVSCCWGHHVVRPGGLAGRQSDIPRLANHAGLAREEKQQEPKSINCGLGAPRSDVLMLT